MVSCSAMWKWAQIQTVIFDYQLGACLFSFSSCFCSSILFFGLIHILYTEPLMPEACNCMTSLSTVINLAFKCPFSALSCLLCHVNFTFSNTSCRFGRGWDFSWVFFPSEHCGILWVSLSSCCYKETRQIILKSQHLLPAEVRLSCSEDSLSLQRGFRFVCSKL